MNEYTTLLFLCHVIVSNQSNVAVRLSSSRPMGGSVGLTSSALPFRRQEKVQAEVETDVDKQAYQRQSGLNQVTVTAAQNFQSAFTRKKLKTHGIKWDGKKACDVVFL